MKIHLPRCGFKSCLYQSDGNCTKPIEYQRCEYASAVQNLEWIMGAQKLCAMCQNNWCKDATTSEVTCVPVWNGLRIGG